MVRRAAEAGFNTLILQVRGRGDAYYRSRWEPPPPALASRNGYDALDRTIREAHRRGLRVHAWINTQLVANADSLPTDSTHFIYRRPDLPALPRPGLRLLPRRARAFPRLARPHAPGLGPHPVRRARAGRPARVQRLLPGRLGSVPAAADHRAGGADLSRREEAQPAPDRERGRIRRRRECVSLAVPGLARLAAPRHHRRRVPDGLYRLDRAVSPADPRGRGDRGGRAGVGGHRRVQEHGGRDGGADRRRALARHRRCGALLV